MNDESHFSLRDTLNAFYRKIGLLKAVLVLVPLGALIACYVLPPVYESTAKIMVTAKKENASLLQLPKEAGSTAYINLNVDETDLNSERELLLSLDLWVRTIKALGANTLKKEVKREGVSAFLAEIEERVKDLLPRKERPKPAPDNAYPPELVELARALMDRLEVVPAPKSKVLDVYFRDEDPETARRVLQALLNQYIPYHMQVYSLPGAESFFSGQGQIYRKRWREAEQALEAFKAKWKISFADKQKSELIGLIKEIENSLVAVEANLDQYREMLTALNKGAMPTGLLGPSANQGADNTVVSVIATQLLRAKQRETLARQHFSPGSRDYKKARELVDKLTEQFRSTIEAEIDVLKAKKNSLIAGREAKQAQLQELQRRSEELRNLQLAAVIAKERYLQYTTKEEQARVENLKGGDKLVNVSIVAKPYTPTSPIFPKTGLMVLASFILAFPLGIGMILVANFLDHTFDNPHELESVTGLPVLASVRRLSRSDLAKKES